ncbi:MAG TPA: HAD-IIB family hydrolase [Geobacteraceae bacterium]|nr:HAD-IIB family hydrolase [Geobacteraceae bacterium]
MNAVSLEKAVVFTDLDGTLLDALSYSFEAAKPALRLIRERGIPLVVCSSKTRKEIEHYRNLLDNHHPFVVENGGGIFMPAGYFSRGPEDACRPLTKEGKYEVISLGTRYELLRKAMGELRNEGFNVTGFGDMAVEEVAVATGLPPEEAEMAKDRDFDEPFIFAGQETRAGELEEAIRKKGLSLTQGSFFHILGGCDKGKAVAILTELYRKKFGSIVTVGLGDSPNDAPMLECVDFPVLVRRPDGSHDPRVRTANLLRADGIGPEGWNRVVLEILSDMIHSE